MKGADADVATGGQARRPRKQQPGVSGARPARCVQQARGARYCGGFKSSPQNTANWFMAMSLTGIPLADFEGTLNVNGKSFPIKGWRGSQNHNWGLRHTERYAWGQVAGFEGHPDAFSEGAAPSSAHSRM